MASSSLSLCQQSQCDAFQFTICRHCQLFLCIKHLAEHQQQFPSDFQRLLDDARKQQAQLSTLDTRYYQIKPSNDEMINISSNRYQQQQTMIDKIGTFIDEHDPTFDDESLFASFGGLINFFYSYIFIYLLIFFLD
jgi:hypothetical protein